MATYNNYNVKTGEKLYLYSDDTADHAAVLSGGTLYASGAGQAEYTLISNGGVGNAYNGGTFKYTTVESGGTLSIELGGVASDTTVMSGARVCGFRYVGADARNIASVCSREIRCDFASAVVSSGWVAHVGADANVYDITIKNGGQMVACGGFTDMVVVESRGVLAVSNLAEINRARLTNGAEASAYNGGTFKNTTVESGGSLFVELGGVASDTTVLSGARVCGFGYVGADARNIVSVCSREIRCDFASAVVSSGWIGKIGADGRVSDITVKKKGLLQVLGGGFATAVVVESTGSMEVDGEATNILISNGGIANVNYGTQKNTTIKSGGSMLVPFGSGSDTTILSGGSLVIRNKHFGSMQIEAGAYVSAAVSAQIVFDLDNHTAAETALINDLSRVQGTPSYAITVADAQANGTYKLADGAAGFNETVTIKNVSGNGGKLTVGNTITIDGLNCRLNLDSSLLSLTVSGSGPTPPPPGTAAGDLNGDGRADIIMTITQTTHPFYGATGAWLIKENRKDWCNLSTRYAGWEIFGTGFTTAGKATDDVYIKSTGNVVVAWTTDATGEVDGWKTVGQFDASTQVLGLGDFNGNGQTDLLLRNTNGAVGCYLTDGTDWNYFQSLGDEWTVTTVGDFNGDGRSDMVLKHDAGFAGTWLTTADGSVDWHPLDTLQNGFEIVGAGDFNGDGIDDVLLKKENYYGAWIVENGSVKSWMGLGDIGDVTVEQVGDFNGDGKDDLRIRTAAGDLGAQLVNGADNLTWKYYGSVGQEWSTSLAAI